MTSETLALILLMLLGGGLALGLTRWQLSRGEQMLEGWCRKAGVVLLSRRHCWILRGPYFWTASKGQVVYKFSVRDKAGRERSGHARCGGYWLGVLTDHVDVTWES
jgi:hypothetical protein